MPNESSNFVLCSGCKDDQTSADIGNVKMSFDLPVGPGGAGGACTNAMMSIFYKNDSTPDVPDVDMTWAKLLVEMRKQLEQKRFEQIPQLSASWNMHLGTPVMVKPKSAIRTKSVLVGINYVGTNNKLSGCHNDVKVMRTFLLSQGYDENMMKVLMDDGQHEQPTKANIEAALKWLSQDVEPGDALAFHYSGHGSHVRDVNNDEKSGRDQVLCPVDDGYILDDWIYENLVKPLPKGVHLFSVTDCCHSGSCMDLPYEIKVTPELAAQFVMLEEEEIECSISMDPNPNFEKKNPSLFAMISAGAAAGAAVGTVGGPVGACLGCLAGGATAAYCSKVL